MRTLDRQEWKSLRWRKEAQASAVTLILLRRAVIFSTLFSALHFASIPTIPQLLFSKKKKATMRDNYSLWAAIFFTFNPSHWMASIALSMRSASILTTVWTIVFVTETIWHKNATFFTLAHAFTQRHTMIDYTDHILKDVHILYGLLELYRSILKVFFLNEEVSFVLQQHDQS